MRKEPQNQTPLRQVKLASELSQREFAKRVGIKFHLYQSLEEGRAKLTKENAYKIYQCSGAMPDSLLPPSRVARAVSGKPYSAEVWQCWQNYLPVLNHDQVNIKDILGWTHF